MMIKRIQYCSIYFTILFCITEVHAQIVWPAFDQTMKPWTRWWWQGSAVDKKNLTAAMEQYRDAGLGGLEITPIYGVKGAENLFIPYLSAPWMNMLQYTLQEAKRLQLGIDLANATGWPFGGPWVKPDDASKNAMIKTYHLLEGEEIIEPIQFKQEPYYRSESKQIIDLSTFKKPVAANAGLQAYALDQVRFGISLKPFTVMAFSDDGTSIDLTHKMDMSGKLNWKAPAGKWRVIALFMGYHGKLVERAAPGGEGDVIDHFSASALQHYLRKFDTAFIGNNISGIRSFFNDSYEVDDANGQSNWTPDLLLEFKKRRGYDLKNYLPQLFSRDSSDLGIRVLTDYRQTISDLLLDNFTQPWQKWAASKNKMVRNQSHGSPANILDLYAAVDIPETEGTDILRFKFATSAAHVTGKPLASAEAATWLNEHFQSSLGDVKLAVDKYFIGGVNHLFWHGTNYSPQDAVWPGWLFYAAVHLTPANPIWKDFGTLNKYVTRCQSFLQRGKPANDVLYYFPFNDRLAMPGRNLLHHFDGMLGWENSPFNLTGEWLLKNGYGFDFISDNQIKQLRTEKGLLNTGGVNYQTIVLSDVSYIPLATMQSLLRLVKLGATLIFQNKIPSKVPGLYAFEKNQKTLQNLIQQLEFVSVKQSNIQMASWGLGKILIGKDMAALLAEAGVQRETITDHSLQFTKRKSAQGYYYFIANTTQKIFSDWVPLEATEKYVFQYDPMTGETGKAKYRWLKNKLQIYLQLLPGASMIIETSSIAKTGAYFSTFKNITAPPDTLTGKWQLEFLSGGPTIPASKILEGTSYWTNFSEEDKQQFSGTASYATHFAKPTIAANHYLLQLGEVKQSAEVFLNGKKMGVLLGPVYQLTIPASLLQADNLLTIKVTNGMSNRIRHLEKTGVVWKKFYNTNFPARLAQNRGADGLFTAIKWNVESSGLQGPVTIQALKELD